MQPEIPSGSKWTRKGDAQLAFLRAAEVLWGRGEITDDDHQSLFGQEPLGFDREGRIVLEYPSAETATAAEGHAVFVRLARALAEKKLSKGLAHKVARSAQRQAAVRRKVLYMPSFLTSCGLPHSKVAGSEYSRVNGNRKLSLLAPAESGLPYGVYPRLALIHLTTEALLRRERTFYVGDSANSFLARMGVHDGGGASGPSTRARDQLTRLCRTAFSYHDKSEEVGQTIVVADKWVAWPGHGLQVTLGEQFYELARKSSVPLDPGIVDGLRRSALSLDAYAWLTHRVATLDRDTVIPWRPLERQFGSDYRHPRQFRWKFRKSLAMIQELWSGVDCEPMEKGLLIRPCAPSVLSWLERAQAKR